MKILIPTDVDNPAPVSSLGGSNIVNNFSFKLRDAALVEVQFFTGNQGFGTPNRPAENLELVFACKPVGLKKSDAVVLTNGFVWDADRQLYVGRPSFKAGQLLGLFVSAAAVQYETADYTLTAAEKSCLVIFSHASTAITITVPALSGLDVDDYIDVLRGGLGDVSLVADSGIALTVAPGLNVTPLLKTQILRITKTGAAAYSVDLAPEADSVPLVGELTWRDLDGDLDAWNSTSDFNVTVSADVYRGFEGTPDNLDDASSYITIAAANAAFATKVELAAEIADLGGDLGTHVARTDNPHGTTKAHVGLALVDNTPDLGKPISTLTQAALDGKNPTLADVVTAGVYQPQSVTLNAKGLITTVRHSRRTVQETSVELVGAAAASGWAEGPECIIPAGSLVVGDVIELFAFGVTNNGTTASNFELGFLQTGISSTMLIAMGVTAATSVPWSYTVRMVVQAIGVSGFAAFHASTLWKTSLALAGGGATVVGFDTTAAISLRFRARFSAAPSGSYVLAVKGGYIRLI